MQINFTVHCTLGFSVGFCDFQIEVYLDNFREFAVTRTAMYNYIQLYILKLYLG